MVAEKGGSRNPLQSDPDLKALVSQVEQIKTTKPFKRWRGSFLSRFEQLLEESSVETAEEAYKKFSKTMEGLVEALEDVNALVDKGDLSSQRATVKARNSVAEMTEKIKQVVAEEDALIPQTGAMETTRGYTKFHIGAVLVRDAFQEYGRLCQCEEILRVMNDHSLKDVADKQILNEIERYSETLKKFCDVMADLGLYRVMMKFREFADKDDDDDDEEEEEAEEEPIVEEPDDIIFIDLKSGGIFLLSRADCIAKRVLTVADTDEDNGRRFTEAAGDDVAKASCIKMLKKSPELGLSAGLSDNSYDDDKVNADLQKVQKMWGGDAEEEAEE